jgi:hypothetical protein
MKCLLLLTSCVALFVCNAVAQTPVGITKQHLKESKGFIRVIKDSIEHIVKPDDALQFKGEYASYIGKVSKVSKLRTGYVLLTLSDDRSYSSVLMFIKGATAKIPRYKGKLVVILGKLDVYKGVPAFWDYGTNESAIHLLRLANPGCNCSKGEPSPVRKLDTNKR